MAVNFDRIISSSKSEEEFLQIFANAFSQQNQLQNHPPYQGEDARTILESFWQALPDRLKK